MENERNKNAEAVVTPEIYFLISKFLADGPLQETAKVLVKELEDKKVLPKRTDWLGNKHELTFKELEQKYSHIEPNHLLQICLRIGPMLDKELKPSVTGLCSLLGRGRQSLLRRQETIYRSRSLLDYCTRWHGASLPDSALTKPVHNFQNVLIGREYGGPVRHKMLVPTSFYSKSKLLRRTVGHLSSVYCVLFDRTGRYIITGADDLLIKIWSALDGRLLATLRGASAEITDIAINLDNTMLAAGSLDRVLRVWDLQTTCPIAVLTGHTGMITSVNFCPSPRTDMKYLVTTSTDGSIAFWQYSMPRGQKINFMPKPIQYHEKLRPGQAQMMCTTFSAGGMFLAAGSADHHVRVYLMSEDGPKRILETEVYTDAVDSVQWAHRGLRFISGSKDGTAHIWTFESQQWKNIKLSMTDRLPSCPAQEGDKKYKVTMVAWDCSDKYVITAVNDFTIKIWNSKNGKLHSVLRGHKDELYVLESNPKDEHVLLSAGHDGQVFLWDIERGISVAHFINDIDGQGHGGVFDAKWSPDGTMIAATDSHGHILIFGLGISPDKYKILPNELFFHTDYRPLLRDASHHVVDEQTQIMPHLMPPPFLVDADGNPHPAQFQRYVPGRESCSTDQLIPNFVIGGDNVIFEDNPNQPNGGNAAAPQPPAAVNANGNFSQIDRLIAALANRQSYAAPAGSQNQSQMDRMLANRQGQQDGQQNAAEPFHRSNSVSSRRSIAGLENGRISGDPERRPESVWGRPVAAAQPDAPNLIETMKFVRCTYVRPMKFCQLQNLRHAVYASGQFEMQEYKREMRRRPIMINTASSLPSAQSGSGGRQRNNRAGGQAGSAARSSRRPRGSRQAPTQAPAYRTRAVRDQEVEVMQAQREDEEEEDEESSGSSGDTSYSNVGEELESSEDSDTESSDYSDWVADTPGPNLEPPKRAKRKPLSHTRQMSDDSSDDNPEQATTSANAAASGAPKRSKNLIPKTGLNGEIPEIYRPAEWLSEVIPRKAPYYPQMGDEVVYFRQGHQRYLEAVRTKKVYKLSASAEPWNFRTLRDHEFVRVIGIKYEIRPPRLCCLKLAMMDEEGNMTGTSFKIKYHDMPDVLDFLVLRQTYDLAVQRNWSIGDRFRCMIGDGWWMGQIESRHPLSNDFPDSYFMCFHVRWDNGEYEYMSPWDMEPIDGNRLPDEVGGAVPVLPEEIRATLYQPKSEEWHRGDRDGSCRRIIAGMEQVMRLSIAEHFLAPVDLNIYPDYAFLIEYPIDLTTIKARFENHFYRRITSAQFDVRYLATNAEKYNRSHTNIVKHARIITDLCLRVIRDPNDMDVAAVYHQLVDVYHSSETENDNESDAVPSTSTGPSTSVVARQKAAATRRSNRIRSDGDWRLDCRQLLDLLIRHPDSAPFREPVDTIEFPDYLEIIPAPMDLRTVKEDLLGGNYDDPLDFAKDVRLIFQNSRNYNTNTRSRDITSIYSMTLRLSSLFEKQIKTVLSNWKAARRRANKGKGPGSGRSSAKRSPPEKNRSAPQTRRNVKTTRRLIDSDDDEDDDEDADPAHGYSRSAATKSRSTALRNGNGGVSRANEASTSSSNNRVTSSSSHRLATAQNGESQTRSSRRRAANKRRRGDSDEDEEEELELDEDDDVDMADKSGGAADASHATTTDDEEKTHDEEDDDDDDDDEDDDDAHSTDVHTSGHNTAASEQSSTTKTRRRGGRGARRHGGGHGSDSQDSEESYKPVRRRRGGRKPANGRRRRSNKGPGRRPKVYDDDAAALPTAISGGGGGNSRQRTRGRPRYGASSMSDDLERDKSPPPAHIDETTQETPSHTPKKKGRPPKNRANNSATATAEHTASSNDPSKPSPTRLTRNNAYQPPRRNAAVTDHSYHLPTRALRHLDSDTDSRENNARFTRRIAAQQPTHNWTEGSAGDESEEGEEILPTPTPTKVKTHESGSVVDLDDRPSTSRAALAAMRKSRLPPKLPTALHDDSDDDSSDNVPLANTQSSENSNGARRHDTRIGNGQVTSVATRYATNVLTRSHATSTTTASVYTSTAASSSSTRASASTSASALPPIHDHNYLGSSAAGTRSRDPQRFSRVGLSRHQRDASELDTSLDPLESSLLLGPSSSSTRLQAASSSTTAAVDEAQQSVRRGRSRFSQQSEPEAGNGEVEEDEEDAEEEEVTADSDAAVEDEEEEHSDSEDDQPLTSYVVQQKKRRGRRPKATKVRRAKRRSGGSGAGDQLSEEDYEDNYDPRNHLSSRKRRHHGEDDYSATNGGNRNRHRGTRNIKRPRYNEQTDEEDGVDARTLGGRGSGGVGGVSVAAAPGGSRLRGKLSTNAASPHKPHRDDHDHHEDEEDATTSDSDEQLVSVSSRGRVRKITARARRIFKD